MTAAGRIAALTGISAADWKELRRAYPRLPAGAGHLAAARRVLLARLAARRLRTGRWDVRFEGDAPRPGDGPTVFVSAHLGSLQALRYTLRARGIRAANVLGPFNLNRSEAERQDRIFDAVHPLDFPHFFPASAVHRVRTALRKGSLVLAADLPLPGQGVAVPLLGGRVFVDPRPFRLARATRVRCRTAFLTLPRGRWTLTIGPVLPREEEAAIAGYARCLAETAARSPIDLDGAVYLRRAREG
jgi:predicted LPLAT superfamily acyltransferase